MEPRHKGSNRHPGRASAGEAKRTYVAEGGGCWVPLTSRSPPISCDAAARSFRSRGGMKPQPPNPGRPAKSKTQCAGCPPRRRRCRVSTSRQHRDRWKNDSSADTTLEAPPMRTTGTAAKPAMARIATTRSTCMEHLHRATDCNPPIFVARQTPHRNRQRWKALRFSAPCLRSSS